MIRKIHPGMAANTLNQIAIFAIQLVLVSVLSSNWGADKYGAWLLLFSIPAYLTISDLGFATASGTKIGMLIAKDRKDLAKQTASTAVVTFGIIFVILAAVSWFLVTFFRWPKVEQYFPSLFEMQVTLLSLCVYAMLCLTSNLLIVFLKHAGNYVTSVSNNMYLFLAEGFGAAALVFANGDFMEVSLFYCAVRALGCIGIFLSLRSAAPWLQISPRDASFDEFKALLPQSLSVAVLSLSTTMFFFGFPLVIGLFASTAAVATFVTVRIMTRAGLQFASVFNNAIIPEVTAAFGRGDWSRIRELERKSLLSIATILIPAVIGLLSLGSWIVRIWSHGAIDAPWSLVAFMTAAMVLNTIWVSKSNFLVAINRQSVFSYVYAAAVVVSVLLAAVACAKFGVVGAAQVVVCLDLFMLIFVFRYLKRNFN